MTGETEFSNANHLQAVKKERRKGKKRDDVNEAKIEEIVKDISPLDFRLFIHAEHTGSCLTVRGTRVTRTVLSDM